MVYLTVRTGYTFFIEGIPMKKSDRKRRPAADKPVRDIYQEVTDRIVAALEKGTRPWKRPWRP
ncbi:ArdC family protein, partial [Klebsiella pneumoniae]